jgi:RsiW-degrading membrane proteinase PrsW (M82 family)
VTILLALALGTAPALAWLAYFVRRDRHEPEPLRMIAAFFSLGALVTVPAGFLNDLGGSALASEQHAAVLVAPLVEEGLKFLVVLLLLRRVPECDEPIDGAIYAISAALGFAALENAGYVLRHGESVMIGRSLFSTLGHGLFAVPWGLALGLQLCGAGRPALTALGVSSGIVLHGSFNFLVGSEHTTAVMVALLVVAACAAMALAHRAFDHALARSPYAGAPLCPACSEPVPETARFCGRCGRAAPVARRCIACGAQVPPEARFCGDCGARAGSSPSPTRPPAG